jgi:hypothetical protein
MAGFLVSGADSAYFPLAQELFASVEAAAPGGKVAFGFIDGGLTEIQRAWLLERGVRLVQPQPPAAARHAVSKHPWLAVSFAKLWLDTLFPDHSTIVWLDSDTWVQQWSAIDLLLGAAETGALAIVPGAGRFAARQIDIHWLLGGLGGLGQVRSFNFKNARRAHLPLAIRRDLGTRAELNAGVFALRWDAPHWSRMREWQALILRHGEPSTTNQLAMALAIYADGMPVELLPTFCNYISPQRVDPISVTLVELYYPYSPVGIVHLASEERMRSDPTATTQLLGVDGATYHANLRYGLFRKTMKRDRSHVESRGLALTFGGTGE